MCVWQKGGREREPCERSPVESGQSAPSSATVKTCVLFTQFEIQLQLIQFSSQLVQLFIKCDIPVSSDSSKFNCHQFFFLNFIYRIWKKATSKGAEHYLEKKGPKQQQEEEQAEVLIAPSSFHDDNVQCLLIVLLLSVGNLCILYAPLFFTLLQSLQSLQ